MGEFAASVGVLIWALVVLATVDVYWAAGEPGYGLTMVVLFEQASGSGLDSSCLPSMRLISLPTSMPMYYYVR